MIKTSQSPCILVIFGATGDLTARKLLPALYHLYRQDPSSIQCICVGVARRIKSHETFRIEQEKAVSTYSRSGPVDPTLWTEFASRIFYYTTEFSDKEAYVRLRNYLHSLDIQYGTKGNRIYYLSTQPQYFSLIVQNLYDSNMLSDRANAWSRIIIEKPFGRDLDSSKALQKELDKYLSEEQIYRVDHYLGKESVQNIPIFRFTNPMIEAFWNHQSIDCVQITISEDIGIGTRGHFFEREGLLRDLIQNHMMQLLALIAMEPPKDFTAHSIQQEKLRALQAIKPFTEAMCDKYVVRGQYSSGIIHGKKVRGYREEKNVDLHSSIETYVAMKLLVDTPRWKGVPFYIRGGKRLSRRIAEITIVFHPSSYSELGAEKNHVSIRIQPREGISLSLYSKLPGFHDKLLQQIPLGFSPESFFSTALPEAYERLLRDCILGNHTLFTTEQEVMQSWKILTPLIRFWEKHRPHFPNYKAGTWGPKAATDLLKKDGREWVVV